ncbi:MAG: hypothetical protein AB4426_04520 [Xenococcaceae cyanobacterium]
MNGLLDWLPYIAISIIPGLFNLTVAYDELNERCKKLPFFQPHKNLGFWLWTAAQFFFPSGVFLLWITDLFSDQPKIDSSLFVKAVGTGLGFVAFLNARTSTKFFSLDIKRIYNYFIDVSYQVIAADETSRAAEFWVDFEKELNKEDANIIEGLNFLEQYLINDISLTDQEKSDCQKKLNSMRTKTSKEEQAKVIISLMDVRRQDLPQVLRRFNCCEEFLKKYKLK